MACYDSVPAEIQNLMTGKIIETEGFFDNSRQSSCKYALIWDAYHKPERYFLYEKLSGKSIELGFKTVNFISDKNDFGERGCFASSDGKMLYKYIERYDSGQKQIYFTALAWDLAQEKLLAKSPEIPFLETRPDDFVDRNILFIKLMGNELFAVFELSHYGKGLVIKEATVSNNGYDVKELYSSDESMPNVRVVENESETIAVFGRIIDKKYNKTGQAGRSWRLNQYNLNTGACLRQEVIKLPDQP